MVEMVAGVIRHRDRLGGCALEQGSSSAGGECAAAIDRKVFEYIECPGSHGDVRASLDGQVIYIRTGIQYREMTSYRGGGNDHSIQPAGKRGGAPIAGYIPGGRISHPG